MNRQLLIIRYTSIKTVMERGNSMSEIKNSGDKGMKIRDILASERPNAQLEVYKLLLVAICNAYNKPMPFLFQPINDYTELLMPDDLLSGSSILALTREAILPEVSGWFWLPHIHSSSASGCP